MAASSDGRDLQVLPDGKKLRALLEDIFTDDFMAAHTRFSDFASLRYSSAVIVNWEADTLIFSQTLLDTFVRESTSFASWDELVRAAVGARYHPQEKGEVL